MPSSPITKRMLYSAPDVDFPGTHGGSTHVGEAVCSFSLLCKHVYLLCAHRRGQPFFDKKDNLIIIRLWIPPLAMFRVASYFFYTFFFSFFLCLFGKIDVVYERARIFGGGAIFGSSFFPISRIYEMIEPYIDVPVVLGKIDNNSLLFSLIRKWHYKIVELSSFVTVTHKSFLLSVPPEKAFFVHTGVDINLFKPNPLSADIVKHYNLVKGKTILYIGSFNDWHSCENIIESILYVAKKDNDVHLLMIGDGKRREDCINLSLKLGLERNIHFIGTIPLEKIPYYINAADICLALFDRTYPPFKKFDYYYSPIKVHEYKACGKPVIASNIGNLKELVVHRKYGLLVDERNVSDISEAILYLIKNPYICKAMGKMARRDVVENYSWDIINTKILKELEKREISC